MSIAPAMSTVTTPKRNAPTKIASWWRCPGAPLRTSSASSARFGACLEPHVPLNWLVMTPQSVGDSSASTDNSFTRSR